MRIERIGFTALKGARHEARPGVELTSRGPRGDRDLALVDRARGRVLRTVENPSLLATTVAWQEDLLVATLPHGTVTGRPEVTGEVLRLDYWGRTVRMAVLAGPWAAAYSEHLGHPVELARPQQPVGPWDRNDVVYGGAVTLVTTGSLRRLAEQVGVPVAAACFRATFVVAADEPHVEDDWVGGLLRVGDAVLRVGGTVPRCAVVDLDPGSGRPHAPVMRALADYRRDGTEVTFGIHAAVQVPGVVHTGDPVTPLHEPAASVTGGS